MSNLDELRERAELLEWAGGSDSWDYGPDAIPTSAYAEWVRLMSPATVLALIAAARRAEALEKALELLHHDIAAGLAQGHSYACTSTGCYVMKALRATLAEEGAPR